MVVIKLNVYIAYVFTSSLSYFFLFNNKLSGHFIYDFYYLKSKISGRLHESSSYFFFQLW